MPDRSTTDRDAPASPLATPPVSGERVHLLESEPAGERHAVCGEVEHSLRGERLNFTIEFGDIECAPCRSEARRCCVAALPRLGGTRPDGDEFTCPTCDKRWAWYEDEAEGGGWWYVGQVALSGSSTDAEARP